MTVLACSRRFHGGVQRQELGLARDLLNENEERPNLVRGGRHRVDSLRALECIRGERLERCRRALEAQAVIVRELAKSLVATETFLRRVTHAGSDLDQSTRLGGQFPDRPVAGRGILAQHVGGCGTFAR